VTVQNNGWTIAADGDRGSLTIKHESLGTVLKDVRLNLQDDHGLRPLNKNWSIEKHGEHELFIRTAQPRISWRFELLPSQLRISNTVSTGVLRGEAPASSGRVIARMMDPEGAPVEWWGTNEVLLNYGGNQTHHPSFLPRRNPECMYFTLGQVSNANTHSLFDRGSDIAISFSDQTLMQRNPQDSDLLDVTLPVPGNTLIRLIPDYYTKTLGVPYYVPFDDSYEAAVKIFIMGKTSGATKSLGRWLGPSTQSITSTAEAKRTACSVMVP